jgi:hypothetical protein
MNLPACLRLLLMAAAPVVVAAEPVQPLPMRDAVRHEDLAEQFSRLDEAARKAEFVPPPAVEGVKERKPVSLLERSEFLSFNGLSTLVPKGSLLNVPDHLSPRTRMVDGNPIVPWAEFFRHNRGWITTMEVSRKQAEADEPLAEETLKSIAKSPLLVVATMAGGPITVLHKPTTPADTGNSTVTPAGNATASAAVIRTSNRSVK